MHGQMARLYFPLIGLCNAKTVWIYVQFLKGLIGMGAPLNTISIGLQYFDNIHYLDMGTPLYTYLHAASVGHALYRRGSLFPLDHSSIPT